MSIERGLAGLHWYCSGNELKIGYAFHFGFGEKGKSSLHCVVLSVHVCRQCKRVTPIKRSMCQRSSQCFTFALQMNCDWDLLHVKLPSRFQVVLGGVSCILGEEIYLSMGHLSTH